MSDEAKCELCGEPMPPGEQMFKFHGYSGPCPKEQKPDPGYKPNDATQVVNNDTLADMAAVELLHVLETPIQGRQSVTIHNYENARRLVKAALLAVFEAATKQPR
jgi:hypothetical protein